MPFPFQPWKFVLAALSEFVRKEQEKAIEYIQLENQILRENLGGNRVLLNDDQRRRLAVKGKALGRQQLKKIATVAQPDTILRWHRELVELNTYTKPKQNVGRPSTPIEVRIRAEESVSTALGGRVLGRVRRTPKAHMTTTQGTSPRPRLGAPGFGLRSNARHSPAPLSRATFLHGSGVIEPTMLRKRLE